MSKAEVIDFMAVRVKRGLVKTVSLSYRDEMIQGLSNDLKKREKYFPDGESIKRSYVKPKFINCENVR